jgi:flagellar motility protein MotE (MotC chaperone)
MARTKDVDGQTVAFPELGDSEKHKELMRIAKRLAKKRASRNELLTNSKEEVDNIEQELVIADARLQAHLLQARRHQGQSEAGQRGRGDQARR